MDIAMGSAMATTVVLEDMASAVDMADGDAKGTPLNQVCPSQHARHKPVGNAGNAWISFLTDFA